MSGFVKRMANALSPDTSVGAQQPQSHQARLSLRAVTNGVKSLVGASQTLTDSLDAGKFTMVVKTHNIQIRGRSFPGFSFTFTPKTHEAGEKLKSAVDMEILNFGHDDQVKSNGSFTVEVSVLHAPDFADLQKKLAAYGIVIPAQQATEAIKERVRIHDSKRQAESTSRAKY